MDEREQARQDKEEAVKIFRRLDYCRELFTAGIFSAFLLTKIFRETGVLVLSATLLVLTCIYVLCISVRYFVGYRRNWGVRVKTAYRGINIGYSLVAVGIAVYGVVTAVNVPSAAEVILSVLSVLFLIIKILVAVVVAAVKAKFGKKETEPVAAPAAQEESAGPIIEPVTQDEKAEPVAESSAEEPQDAAEEKKEEQDIPQEPPQTETEKTEVSAEETKEEEPKEKPKKKRIKNFFVWLFGKIPNDK